MGNEPPKKDYNPKMEKLNFEIACIKVKEHLVIQRDRKIADTNNKEKQLLQIIQAQNRSAQDEDFKAAAIVTNINYINGCNIIIRFCEVLKDRSLLICESKGKQDTIKDLMPMIESIMWSAQPLNLTAINEFSGLMNRFFGSMALQQNNGQQVDLDLKKCFQNPLPSKQEINDYMIKFSQKFGVPIEVINQAGHEYSPMYNYSQTQQSQQQAYIPIVNSNNFPQVGNAKLDINVQVIQQPNPFQQPINQYQQQPQGNYQNQGFQQSQQQQQSFGTGNFSNFTHNTNNNNVTDPFANNQFIQQQQQPQNFSQANNFNNQGFSIQQPPQFPQQSQQQNNYSFTNQPVIQSQQQQQQGFGQPQNFAQNQGGFGQPQNFAQNQGGFGFQNAQQQQTGGFNQQGDQQPNFQNFGNDISSAQQAFGLLPPPSNSGQNNNNTLDDIEKRFNNLKK